MYFKSMMLITVVASFIWAKTYDLYLIDKTGTKRVVKNSDTPSDMSIYESKNVTRKSTFATKSSCEDVAVLKSDKEFLIESKTFGPPPITLKVYDTNNKVILTQTKKDVSYEFLINLTTHDAKKVEVRNYFGDMLLCQILNKE